MSNRHSDSMLSRRQFLRAGLGLAAASVLTGCMAGQDAATQTQHTAPPDQASTNTESPLATVGFGFYDPFGYSSHDVYLWDEWPQSLLALEFHC